jgi:hypothetical protein
LTPRAAVRGTGPGVATVRHKVTAVWVTQCATPDRLADKADVLVFLVAPLDWSTGSPTGERLVVKERLDWKGSCVVGG